MPDSLDAIIAGMREIIPQNSYYALTLTANESGEISWSAQTSWAGFADDDFRTEIRAASLVIADRMGRLWAKLGQPYVVVNETAHLYVYLMIGGNALVEQQLAQELLTEVIAPTPVRRPSFFGYKPLSTFSEAAFKRVPTPKQRMRVLKRDKYRCRICGRKADDHVDVELHVHHVKPWGEDGLTVDDNLITLCHTCHKGLDPHEDIGLAIFLESLDAESGRRQLLDGIRHYRMGAWRSSLRCPTTKRP
jgi:HNH endonuclease